MYSYRIIVADALQYTFEHVAILWGTCSYRISAIIVAVLRADRDCRGLWQSCAGDWFWRSTETSKTTLPPSKKM